MSSSRQLKKLPRGEEPSGSCSSSSSSDNNDMSPPPPPPSGVEDSIDRLASVVHHKTASSSTTSNVQNEEEDAASSIAAMSKGLAAGMDSRSSSVTRGDIPAAFVPPPFESRSGTSGDAAGSSRSSHSDKRDRHLEKSSPITGNDHQVSTSVKPSSSSHRGAQHHHETTPNHPSRVATSAAAAAASSQRRRQDTSTTSTTTTPSMSRAAIAPPIVTMETRRNTFDNVDPFRKKKKKSKIRFQDDPTGQLYSSSSSELDEETARLKDLFSPPSPSSLRSRRHTNTAGMMLADDSLQATVTASTSVEASHHDESPREQVHYPQHQYYAAQHHYPPPPHHQYPPPPHGYAYESPPTIYVDTARQNDPRGMTLSSSRRHNYHGRVVHIPKAKDSNSSSSEEDVSLSHHHYGGPGRRRPYKSAPARIPVSRQSIYRRVPQGHPPSSTPSSQQRRRRRHDLAMQAEYDSHEDNIQAALQLSFDSQSPDVSPNNNVGSGVGRGQQGSSSSSSSQRRQNVHRERNPSPTKKLRANSSGSASSGEQQRYPPSSSRQQHHPQHQVQHYPPGYNTYYPYGHPQMTMAVPPGGEGYGYSGHAQWSQQKYPPPPPPGQQGYGWHPSQQQYQQQFAGPPPPPTPTGVSRRPQQQRTPASKRKKGREGNLKVDTTMETAELSYEDEQHLGLMSPPSPKKKRDATHGLPAEWHSSPPQEFLRNLELDTTPQRANASLQRDRQGEGEDEEITTPPDRYQIPFTNSFGQIPFTNSFGFGFTHSFGEGFLPTPSAGADQAIFTAASWSPSAMQAFGREFLGPQFPEDSDGLLRPPILRDDDTYSFGTSLSPSNGNSITIRGSPILKKTDRTKDDDETPAPPPSEEEEAPEEGCPDDIQHEPQPQQVRSSPPPPVAHTTTIKTTTTAPTWKTLPKSSSGVGGMRVKIGGSVGMDITEARRGIEGINSVLRGSPVSAPPTNTTAVSAPPSKKPKATTHQTMGPPPQTVHPLPQGMADMRINYGSSATTHGYACMPAQPPISTSSGVKQAALMMMTPVAHTRRGGSGKEISSNDTGGRTVGPCNCKNSKCLKLYCVCFAAEEYCYGCKCIDCKNTPSHEVIRKEAIVNLKQKNPKAFKTKFTETTNAHASGCRCKKSQCLKKYCECFNSGVTCGEKCKCSNCKNYVGSQALLERRRKMKDFRGVDAAIEASQKAGVTETEIWPQENTSSPVVHHPDRRMPRTDTKKDLSKPPSSVPRGQPPASAPSKQQQKYHPQQPQQYQQQQQQQQQMMISPMHQMQFSPPPGYPQQYVQQQYPGMMMQQQQQYPPSMFHHASGHPQYALPMKQPVVRTAAYQKRLEDQLRRAKETKSEGKYKFNALTRKTALNIFSYLTKDDLFNASIVSKTFRDAVDDSLHTGWM